MTAGEIPLLEELLAAPGPSGFEGRPQAIWTAAAAGIADEVRRDVSGNARATLRGADPAAPTVMFAGHMDEIGLMIVHVDDEGFLWFDPIGGWDPQVFVGQRVTLLGREGLVPGVIGKKAVHLMEKKDRETVSTAAELWIDIGATDRDDALTRTRVGDAGVLAGPPQRLPGGRLVSRSLDNRIGAFVVLEALRLLTSPRPAVQVTAVATAQEEIAYTGGGARPSAQDLAPVCAVVVDVTHATDTPGVEKKRHGDVRLGGGPVLSRGSAVHPLVFEQLVAAAEREEIPYTLLAAARHTGTDADQIFTSARGVATGVLSVPLRYMHSPNEMASLADVERAARLLAAFARGLPPDVDFTVR